MPHLKIRGMAKQPIIENSKELIDGLTEIVKCDRTWFTIEHIDTEYIFDGKIVEGYTFVELFWFERTQWKQRLLCNLLPTSRGKLLRQWRVFLRLIY